MTLDDTDRRLVALLRTDGRLPASSLAAALGVSRGTVQNRIDRLVREGVIQGFTVRLRPDAVAPAVRAVCMVEVHGRSANAVLKALRGFPEVRALHTTNGRWDVVAELETESLEAFDRALRDIRTLDGIANTETSLLLSSHKL
jgi:DNA-binding Lrp family transcriptional regulator